MLVTVRSPAEKLWLDCGMVSDIMLCDTGIQTQVKLLMLLPILKSDLRHNSFIRKVVEPVLTRL
jgi:hypothetical protein